ncbi:MULTISPECIES: DUF664 domain-containing protein [Actinomycetes]|uniref:DUF664 domain-containing protein n=1 Tax=Streptomyces tendae TaxID=1932 RepID=A0A6B3QPJ0_STRTE|nr:MULTISPECIES: DUF664 domain-containing protein [Streptomyces]BET45202.1 hypothetical protein RGQ21_01840 [Kitasatospora aureofaciens]MBQ0968664.1 DUF664 domain-containing protein [Streptomyces sp. RK74B]MBQ1008663.1 DUF664 domain-containing protein [Streptomyces sp. RK23]MZG15468.1 DUF664 domain-containing protein [Streptomyces sp. SID5914]NEV89882.1 DUF664 domain-containing protein [Streptomyces tendae]
MPDDEQTGALEEATRMMLDAVAAHRMAVGSHFEELAGLQLDKAAAMLKPDGTVTRTLRELTSQELNFLAYAEASSSPGSVRRHELPSHDTEGGAEVFATWQTVCERSRRATQYLSRSCTRGLLEEAELRKALLHLFGEYARCEAKLQILRNHCE